MARWPPLLDERGATRWGFRSKFISSNLSFLHFNTFCTYFSPIVSIFELSFYLCRSLFLTVFLNDFADHHAAISNFILVSQPSLDKILQSEVFVHKDD